MGEKLLKCQDFELNFTKRLPFQDKYLKVKDNCTNKPNSPIFPHNDFYNTDQAMWFVIYYNIVKFMKIP